MQHGEKHCALQRETETALRRQLLDQDPDTAVAPQALEELGKVCLVGCRELAIDLAKRSCSIGGKLLREGQVIALDGGAGGVYSGAVDIVRAKPERELAAVASWRGEARAKRLRRAA